MTLVARVRDDVLLQQIGAAPEPFWERCSKPGEIARATFFQMVRLTIDVPESVLCAFQAPCGEVLEEARG